MTHLPDPGPYRHAAVRVAVAVLALVAALLPRSQPVSATVSAPTSVRAVAAGSVVSLPGPTGRHQVGTVSLHLVDGTRHDPWVPSHPLRELMVQLWYPAARSAGFPRARYIPALAGRLLDAQTAQALATSVPTGTFHGLRTHSYQDAPVARSAKAGRPVILLSPGDGMDRSSLTSVAEDLASHGFLVAGIDHTHDSGQVEFPGGRVEVAQNIPPGSADEETLVRTADVRFVLDQLTRLNTGANPDADHQRLPAFRNTLDLARTGMFGHSHGAEATAETMLQDRRITAGAELDGGVSDRVAAAGLHSPFMVISGNSAAGHPLTEENLTTLWPRLTGWGRWLRLRDSGHLSFTDFEIFAPELNTPPNTRQQLFGTLDPQRAVAIERTYLLAFFTWQLDHHHQRLLDRPSNRYPEMIFER
ncbi:alpha/beta hydrolase family protein [Actinoallomurus acaciae]|uniref:Alpha/beta hydrolase family protein n=1 Tax=Actinoallomurus acaciae TaxID=502577 RepID=A0ABV5YQK0_9ACTN